MRIKMCIKMGHDHIQYYLKARPVLGFNFKIDMPPFYRELASYLSYKNKNLFKNLNSLKLH